MKHYTTLAGLFSYPEPGLRSCVNEVRNLMDEKYPDLADKLSGFREFINSNSLDVHREYYIKTFDVQASCHLDIGAVLFGEDYKRGEFLVYMVNEQKNAGNDCGDELADHLPNILTLLPKIINEDFAAELAYSIMIPALKEMIKNFKGDANIYKPVVEMLLNIMEADFHGLEYKQFEVLENVKSDFLNSCDPKHCKAATREPLLTKKL